MAWEWLAPSAVAVGAAASFVGARLGARANRDASAAATAQRELQARRDEWGRRFVSALDRTGSDDPLQRRLAVVIMANLVRSELAGPDDRALAQRVWEMLVRTPVNLLEQHMDDTHVVVETGASPGEGSEPT